MKRSNMKFLYYKIVVKIDGNGVERLLNDALRKGVRFQNLKRKETSVTAIITLEEFSKLRSIRRKHGCFIKVERRIGLSFFMKRMGKYHGFTVGIVLAFFLILTLSNVIWGIKIEGASPKTEYMIQKKLKTYGIAVGKPSFLLDDVVKLQKKLTMDINNITWIGVEKKGTIFHLKVVEKLQPKKSKELQPRDLVAKKEAIITKMYVEKGKPIVSVNEHVERGQVLVSGAIGGENYVRFVPSKGSVFGETWYEAEVEVPLKTSFSVLNGKFEKQYRMSLGNFSFPIWGFDKPDKSKVKKLEIDHPLYFFKYKLPISFQTKALYEKEQIDREYTEEEAIEMGREMARKDVKKKIGNYGKILGESMITIKNEKDIVKLKFKVEAEENIATDAPITYEKQETKE